MANHPLQKNPTLNRILQVLRDQVWQFVGAIMGVIIGVLTVLSSYHALSLQREIKALQVVILASTSLVEVEQSMTDEIKVLYRDQPVAALSISGQGREQWQSGNSRGRLCTSCKVYFSVTGRDS